MKTSLAFLSLLAGANAFVPVAPMVSSRAVASAATSAVEHVPMRMGLNPELAANFPRDFANVSVYCELLRLLARFARTCFVSLSWIHGRDCCIYT